MYHAVVSDNNRIIAHSLCEGLGEAVLFGHKTGRKGNLISIYESVQDATGEIVHLHETLTTVLEENPKGYS